jgi:glycosyltransferase involved in cell wall biosynthesis
VLVGPEHTAGIARWSASSEDTRLRFVEVGEPGWGRYAKRHRTTWFLLYLSWLRRAKREAWRLHEERAFDLTCHATYSAFWLPSPATSMNLPSIWGPVGGAIVTPPPLRPVLGARGLAGELLDAVAIRVLARLPVTRRTWREATVRIVQNEATLAFLPPDLRAGTRLMNHAPLVELPPPWPRSPRRRILAVGALDARKGVALAIRALAHTPDDVELVVAGDGPRRAALESLARRLGVSQRVRFLGQVGRTDVFRLWETAAAAIFTGLREEGGLALAEAMMFGTPVVVLSHGGARTLAASAMDPSRVALIAPGPVEGVARGLGEAMTRFCDAASADHRPNLDPSRSHACLHAAVQEALAGTNWGSAASDDRAAPPAMESVAMRTTGSAEPGGAT